VLGGLTLTQRRWKKFRLHGIDRTWQCPSDPDFNSSTIPPPNISHRHLIQASAHVRRVGGGAVKLLPSAVDQDYIQVSGDFSPGGGGFARDRTKAGPYGGREKRGKWEELGFFNDFSFPLFVLPYRWQREVAVKIAWVGYCWFFVKCRWLYIQNDFLTS
jgi:hypothetical protein